MFMLPVLSRLYFTALSVFILSKSGGFWRWCVLYVKLFCWALLIIWIIKWYNYNVSEAGFCFRIQVDLNKPHALSRSEASATRGPNKYTLSSSSPFLPEDGSRIQLPKHCSFIIIWFRRWTKSKRTILLKFSSSSPALYGLAPACFHIIPIIWSIFLCPFILLVCTEEQVLGVCYCPYCCDDLIAFLCRCLFFLFTE
jgi:hypothetical protein